VKYRQLGKTELAVSEIGLGCSGFWGDKHFSEKKAIDIVLTAYDNGVNLLDTGSNYSNFNAEPRLGRAVAEILRNNPRNSLVISTKAGSLSGYAPRVEDNDLTNTDFSAEAIRRSCHQSIKNLKCDYIDIFQLHGFKKEEMGDDIFNCLLSLRQEGLVRYVGINTHFRDDLLTIIKYPDVFDMVLIDCNVLQLDRYEIIQKLRQGGIGVVVGTVLAQGHLVSRKIGSIRNGSFFWYLARTLIKPTTREFARSSTAMREALSSITEMTAAQAAFAYLLENQDIASCLFGTTNMANLLEVISAPEKKLTPQSKSIIWDTYERNKSLSR
jgi:aryl-alcohol dehydrogenase-like predicted oxidoreductase